MGKPRNTQKYPTYPEIPEIPGNTRKKKRYPEIPDRIFWHSYPTRTWPATRYFVQYPTRPDPILKNPTRWALHIRDDSRPRMILGLISNWWWNFLPWIINHLLSAPGGKTIHTIQNYPPKTEILAKMLSRNIHFLGCAKHQKVEHSLRADDVCPWLLLVKA